MIALMGSHNFADYLFLFVFGILYGAICIGAVYLRILMPLYFYIKEIFYNRKGES